MVQLNQFFFKENNSQITFVIKKRKMSIHLDLRVLRLQNRKLKFNTSYVAYSTAQDITHTEHQFLYA